MNASLANDYFSLALNATGVVIKSKAGALVGFIASNSNAAARYLKLYDKATAATSSDTPILSVLIPAGQTVPFVVPGGIALAAGLSARCVTGIANNDNTGAGAGEVAVSIFSL